jgi:AICARFT/IMPCHase bienzyme
VDCRGRDWAGQAVGDGGSTRRGGAVATTPGHSHRPSTTPAVRLIVPMKRAGEPSSPCQIVRSSPSTCQKYSRAKGQNGPGPSSLNSVERNDSRTLEVVVPRCIHNATISAQATLRYTQSNSMCVARDGMVLGIGAGQQNRVDCTRLAGEKARTWWLRRHPAVRGLTSRDLRRQDLLNWQIRFAEQTLTPLQESQLVELFGSDVFDIYRETSWRPVWTAALTDLAMASDGFIPFRENVDLAATLGVKTLIEPGGSSRT